MNEKRRRSHWAWGWEDALPGDEERQNLGQMAAGLLGFEPESIERPIALDAIAPPPPRIAPPFEFCAIDDESRIRHTYGRAYRDIVRGFRGEFDTPPDAVAHPADEAEIAALLDWADEQGVAVVPFGGGTSVVDGVGSNVDGDWKGVVSLDLGALDQVLTVDPKSLAARIQAGATGPRLEEQLAQHGLTLRHFPQSFEFSTLGGWIATRAGGHFATVRTHIDDFVESTRMITPSGVMETRRLPASGAGPSPDRIVLGSEGIFGVITDAWMRVQRKPTHKATASWKFERWRDAVAAVRALGQSGLNPSNCRLLDKNEAMMNQVSFDGQHVLIVGFESAGLPVEDRMRLAGELCTDHGGTCPDGVRLRTPDDEARDESAGSWRDAFFRGPYLQSALVTLGIMADTFESAVTWDRFDEFHRGVKDAVIAALNEVCGTGLVTCRFTHVYPDGVAPYYTFIGPAKRGSEISQWREVKSAASDAIIAHGGTITHHHAVGRTHRPWWEEQRPERWDAMLRAAKGAVDPNGIMNPGILLTPGSRN